MSLDLTRLPTLSKNVGRAVEIATVLVRYGFADLLARLDARFVRRLLSSAGLEPIVGVSHEARVRLALTDLGVTFIKLGQMLSTRPDLVGPALAAELARLQSDVPADSFPVTRATVEAELKRPLGELFAEFGETPLASASIGQCHPAVLPDGRRVVVKVQHPDVERRALTDLSILAEIAPLAEALLPEVRPYRPVGVVAEFRRVLLRELDFRRELRHLTIFNRNFAAEPGVRFPAPVPALSTARVLTMDRLDGISLAKVDDVRAAGHDPHALARRGARLFLDMIFRDGFYHADPHPGNLLVLPDGTLGLLDAGMVGRVDDRLRDRIQRGVEAVIVGDADAVTNLIVQLGDPPPGFDPTELRAEVTDQLAFYRGLPFEQFELSAALTELTDAVRRYQVVLPPPLALLLKVLVMLEGTARLVCPTFNLVETLEEYRGRLVRQRLAPRRLLRQVWATAADWEELVRQVPRVLRDAFRRAERHQLSVQLEHRHLEPSVNRLVFGLMVSALFVGSAFLWAMSAPPLVAGTSAFGAAGCLISCVLGYRLFRAIQKSGRLEDEQP